MDYSKSLQWFDRLMKDDGNDAEGGYDSVLTRLAPPHEVLANQAQIYLKGGYGVKKDPNRAGNYIYCFDYLCFYILMATAAM